jgi:ferredoxin
VTVVTDKGEMQVPVTPFIKDFSIINLAKLKTHGLTILTGAMKNLYGLIPGYHKSLLHSKFITPWEFSGFLADYYHEVSKYLSFNIVDAVVSMEGEGPSSGKLKKTGYLIGGRNAVAIERVCCQLLGVNERSVPYLQRYKEKYGLPEVEIKGDELVPVKGFVVPGKRLSKFMSNKVIKFILNILAKHFHIMPVIEPEKCKKCYACVHVCPVNAISKELVFDRKICINCLCCFEVCPYKAIKVKKNWIAKFFT